MFYKLLGICILILSLPTVLVFIRKMCLKGLKEVTEKERAEKAQLEEINYMHLQKQLKEIYEVESKPLYLQARDLFNKSMKSGKLHKEEINYLEKLVTESLGAYINEYKYYKFKNKAHKLYVLMKDIHIEPKQWELIIYFLERVG